MFCSGRIRTLVAMATDRLHKIIMGKVEIDQKICLIGDSWIFLQKYLLSSPQSFIRLLSKLLNLIGCKGDRKG